MKACYIHGIRDVRVGEAEAPSAGGERVLIRVGGVGICGSDLHYYQEGSTGSAAIQAPFVPGHEMAGWLLEDRPELGLREGQLVAVDPAKPCGACEWCRHGHINVCPFVEFLGAPPCHGAMAERIAVSPGQVWPLPDGFTVDRAVMLEPLGVGVHALDLAKPRMLDTVAVIGCGPIGLGLVQLARLAGAGRVYALDPVAYRLAAAERLGADASTADRAEIQDWTHGRGVDRVLEATNAPDGFQHACDSARIGGHIVLTGIPAGDTYALGAAGARRKGLTVKFSRRMGHVYPRAIQLVAEGWLDVDRIVTHHFSLADAACGFELQADCREGALKSIIAPHAE